MGVILDRLRRHGILEPVILTAIILFTLMAFGFIEIVDDVFEGDTHGVDTYLLMLMRTPGDPSDPWGPLWLEDMMRDISALGGIAILTLVTLSSALYLAIQNKGGRALYLLVIVATGTVLSNVLKFGFDRPRPDLVPHESITFTASFPSGHSMMAALVYLTLGALLAQPQPARRMKAYLIGIAVAITVLVGISRVYLGVHWPSDVLAGWLVGAMWALLFWTIERVALRKKEPFTNP